MYQYLNGYEKAGLFFVRFGWNSILLKIPKLDFLPSKLVFLPWNSNFRQFYASPFIQKIFVKLQVTIFSFLKYMYFIYQLWVNGQNGSITTKVIQSVKKTSDKLSLLVLKTPKLISRIVKLVFKTQKLDWKTAKLDLKTPKLLSPAF